MGSQLFGPLNRRTAVKVGYIDKDKGFVGGLTVAEANEHASKDPGTTFIFKSGDNVLRYLNINEVNALTEQDTKRGADTSTANGAGAGSNGCPGVNQKVTIGPPNIVLKGGGGIGALGNPIVGADGSILAVDVVRTGHGYTFPPIVTAKDDGNYGNGAVLRAVLGELVIIDDELAIQSTDGSISYGLTFGSNIGSIRGGGTDGGTDGGNGGPGSGFNLRNDGSVRGYRGTNRAQLYQYYDRADDYEEYILTIEDPIPAGTLWGPNGEDLGEFDPVAVMGGGDPILEQVQEFEDIVRALEGGFFHTRKYKPAKISSNNPKVGADWIHVDDTTYLQEVYGRTDVPPGTHRWGDFMNTYAISPKPPSSAPGSDFAGILFTYEWNIDFPTTGEYTIKGARDNRSKLYIDNEFIMELDGFKGAINPVKKFYEAGNKNIRLDLLNIPQYETITVKPVPQTGEFAVVYRGLSAGSVNNVKGEKSYAIRTEGESRTAGRRVRNNGKEIQFDDDINNGFDENASLKIESTSPGVSAKFNGDGTQMIVKGRGDVSLKFSWDDNPRTKGLSVGTLKVGNGSKVSWTTRQRGEKGSDRKTINVGENDTKEVIRGLEVSNDRKRVKMRDGHGDDINSTFFIESSTNKAKFSADGKKLEYDGDGEITLTLQWDDNPNIAGVAVDKIEIGNQVWDQKGGKGSVTRKIKVKPTRSSTGQLESNVTVFDTVDYINKADRKLWRTNVFGRGGFINEHGVCPFPTRKSLPDNPYAGTHVIRWANVNFPKDGDYIIEMEVDDNAKVFIGNRSGDGNIGIGNGLRSIDDGGDEVIIEKKGFKPNSNQGTGKSTYTRFFKKGKYRIRTELTQKEGGRFSFDTDSNGNVKSDVKARFVQDGNGYALKVTGSGSAQINFNLRTDDNPKISGMALTQVNIGDVQLKRSSRKNFNASGKSRFQGRASNTEVFKEKETISGSGVFEAGRTYKVNVKGSSPTTGAKLSGVNFPADSILFDDNVSNGFDLNATLKITRINNITTNSGRGINPMAFAMRIRSDFAEQVKVVSPRSWNDNPMGVALTIDAPPPTVPQEPPLVQEGRCPPNPIWTTRAPRGSEQWYPVTYPRAWSNFMDRYAMSPVKPLAGRSTDNGGVQFNNSWDVQVDFPGFYGVKAAADNFGSVWIDGNKVYDTKGFSEVDPETKKVFLDVGSHNVEVKVENEETTVFNTIRKKVFCSLDWTQKQKDKNAKVPVKFQVYGQGSKANCAINFAFTSEDGKHSFVIESRKKEGSNTYEYDRTIDIFPGVNYKVESVSTSQPITRAGEVELPIKIEGRSRTAGRRLKSKREIEFDDDIGNGFDWNAGFKIMSTSPGVSAKFSDDGTKILAKGNGTITLRLKWDDNPRTKGQAVNTLKVGGKTFKQRSEKGERIEVISVNTNVTSPLVLEQGTLKRGNFRKGWKDPRNESSGPSDLIFADAIGSVNDNDDMQIRTTKGIFTPGKKKKGVVGTSGQGTQRRNTYELSFRVDPDRESTTERNIDGVSYAGPPLFNFNHKAWSKFMNKFNASPYIPPLDRDDPVITGTRTYTWSNVNFIEDGRYDVQFQHDDQAKLFIDDQLIIDERGNFKGVPAVRKINVSKGRRTVKVEVNNIRFERNAFTNNPTGFALKIEKDIQVPGGSQPWSTNPMGISAVLIAPPCPRPIDGKGLVTDIIVEDGGNGYIPPTTGGPGYPVQLKLKEVLVEDPGINYNCGVDEVVVEPSNGAVLSYECNTFGRITKITVENPGMGFTEKPIIRVASPPATGTNPGPTGINFKAVPVFEVERDPVEGLTGAIPPDKLIQVTDLVGLKQTGYYDGRPYYGAVFFKDGVRYAGYYETAGQLVQIYDTLQESVDGEVVTRPSAIQRQGTDTNSNNPRINLPGTPENLS